MASRELSAVAYVRMSTDHQDLSIDLQLNAIRRYADEHRMALSRVYEDAARSGLRLSNRAGMKTAAARCSGRAAPVRRGTRVRRESVGTISGCRRRGLLRIHLPSARGTSDLCTGTIQPGHKPHFIDAQEREARHGCRILARNGGESVAPARMLRSPWVFKWDHCLPSASCAWPSTRRDHLASCSEDSARHFKTNASHGHRARSTKSNWCGASSAGTAILLPRSKTSLGAFGLKATCLTRADRSRPRW